MARGFGAVWWGEGTPRTIKLSELGLVEAVTPVWLITNRVRILAPGWVRAGGAILFRRNHGEPHQAFGRPYLPQSLRVSGASHLVHPRRSSS